MTETVHKKPWADATKFAKKNVSLAVLLLFVLAILYLYYGMTSQARDDLSDTMEQWKGKTGHGLYLAYGGVLFLVVAQAYTLVKRLGLPLVMRSLGGPGLWLNVHIALSVVGTLAILVHAGFPYRFRTSSLTSIAYAGLATWLLIIVSVSGVFGRYLYRRLPAGKKVFGYWKQTHLLVTILFFVFTIIHILGAED